ncbi:Clavaminate synthase-like protein [Pseudovirgaria hyperparasitica]|uniref:Clavaminate synthase-like protein n=1 Tax=Pseudovirgaria hyperparasitica TaxID=470096 RepID=A0A6A6VXU9_9PEZI|nr:Clavaminate synthase-like protein [Pseudovirgaria hyperparasitica]KAF2754097.1 Clavaminate synthase-like protein [Pseudovirgaria hyperparasitica]
MSKESFTLNDRIHLRDSCICPKCIHPSTRQKEFQTCDIPQDIQIRDLHVSPRGITIKWAPEVPGYSEDHETELSQAFLQEVAGVKAQLDDGAYVDRQTTWDRETITKNNLWLDYNDYIEEDEILYEAIKHVHKYGLLFLRSVPDDETAVERIVGRMGRLHDTFYGRTWDVKSIPNSKNVAYTQQFLGLHMDLLYTTNPPHLQFLHSLRARAPGGNSLFSDSYRAAETMYLHHRKLFHVLCNFPVQYHYHNDSQHYYYTRYTFERRPFPLLPPSLDPASGEEGGTTANISKVNWSPPFQAPFSMASDYAPAQPQGSRPTLAEYLEAAKKFNELITAEENLFEYRLQEGDCVVFDNRRTLHARREFDASKGERWLKGAYLSDDAFYSRYRVLEEMFDGQWVEDGRVRHPVETL